MRRIQGTTQLAATPAEVWAFVSDPANVVRWQTGVISSERTSPPPTVAGSTGRVVFEVMGQRDDPLIFFLGHDAMDADLWQ